MQLTNLHAPSKNYVEMKEINEYFHFHMVMLGEVCEPNIWAKILLWEAMGSHIKNEFFNIIK